MLGKVFGAREHVPSYVAGLVTLFLLIMIAAVLFFPLQGDITKSQAVQTLGGFLLAALGYLFGSASGGKKD